MGPRASAWLMMLVAAAAVGAVAARRDQAQARAGAVVLSAAQRGCLIVVPSAAREGERRAAATLQATLAKAAGRSPADFPVVEERGGLPRRALWVGATRRGAALFPPARTPPLDTGVGRMVRAGSVFLWGEQRDAIEGAAGWFLERELGAQWFIPGALGEQVAPRAEFTLAPGEASARPGFLHRDLGVGGGEEMRAWYGRNRLQARFEHGHNLANVFRPADFERIPEMAPVRNGRRFIPPANSANWQPNLLSEAAVRHAAAAAMRAFDRDPQRLSFALSVNDTDLYDESAATLAAVAPPRFFRHRPDYSPLVFGFTNAVARLVGQRHPDRWLPAYAYYWCENAPGFAVERNVVPFLTADRSQWSHPQFAAEDQALIQRWCRSGAGIVGAYDYFYGAPHFAPRPTLYAVSDSIPFHHRAGVRAFYAETNSNWGLDGPKAWLAAKLLWSPEQDPAALLDLYYREFWGEAAEPMRAFFAVAERTWREQPGPPLWLRFYHDEDQAWVYRPERRGELRTHLDRARAAATTEIVRARVELTAAGLSVTEAFWEFTGAREQASRLAREDADAETSVAAWRRYHAARDEFLRRYGAVRRDAPLALAPQHLAMYLRNQPDSRVARALVASAEGRAALERERALAWRTLGATVAQLREVLSRGEETLLDPGWHSVEARPVGSSAVSDWTEPGAPWMGSGEAWEGRVVRMMGEGGAPRAVRFSGCRTEGIGQWQPARPQALYAATAKVRARTSPGTATFLVVSFLDAQGEHIDAGRVDRLPPGPEVQETTLCVIGRAPPHATHVGYAVRVLNQINDDFAEFSAASLRRLDP